MGISISPELFQEKMNEFSMDLNLSEAYIDDLLLIAKGD